jgi:starch synthase
MTRIVFCASEAAPFAKVGGLGDVVGSLPKALAGLGLKPLIVLPRYGFISPEEAHLTRLPHQITVNLMGKPVTLGVWQGKLPGTAHDQEVPVYFLENDIFTNRETVYPPNPIQEVEGFLLLSKAVFPLLKALDLPPDILHLHDWHTAPACIDLLEERKRDPFFARTRSVLTLHNMMYQGTHHPSGINWLGEGLRSADFVTAVSPTYAKEIQTPELGEGLEGATRQLAAEQRLVGILNGIDTELFDPMRDTFIPEHYDIQTARAGKSLCKRIIQQELGLPLQPEVPLFGMVTRLTEQKGFDLLLPIMEWLANRQAQWVILGTGDPGYESLLRECNARFKNIRSYIGFNLALAQKIYAGSDVFVMPSRFEPCGLGQLIAFRYGAVPLVRATGGLADTVIDIRSHYQLGNGFTFGPYQSSALLEAVDTAISYYQDTESWNHLIHNGMSEDYSWERSAKAYKEVYQTVLRGRPVHS